MASRQPYPPTCRSSRLPRSRSLGDTVAHSAGVTSEPEFTFHTLNPETDVCLVVASDGLWEFMDDQTVIDMIGAFKNPKARRYLSRAHDSSRD